MNKTFLDFAKRFGLKEGIKLWYKFRYGITNELKLKELDSCIYMTPNSLDNASFKEIFFDQEYLIEYPKWMYSQQLNIIDAGANIGFASVFFANKFQNANIISIEPDEENFKWLKKNTKDYNGVNPLKGAIWFENEKVQISDDQWGSRGYMVDKGGKEEEKSIDGYTVDTIMNMFEFKHIDIFKIDIEGSEKDIFESNFENWIPKTKIIIIELHDRMKKGCSEVVFKTMKKFDFTYYNRGENVVFVNKNYN